MQEKSLLEDQDMEQPENNGQEQSANQLMHSCEICKSSEGFMLKCLKKHCREYVHAFCVSESILKEDLEEARGNDDDDNAVMDSDSEQDDEAGWAFEYKLQNYATISYLSSLQNDLLKTMLSNQKFFDDNLGPDGTNVVLTPEASPKKDFMFKGKT
jgi:hypothetical protein